MLTFCVNEHYVSNDINAGHHAKLLFICKAEGKEAAIPRIMHRHEERIELLFIVQGEGVYNINGRRYNVKRGDLLVFNAGVLHDENPLASDDLLVFSCGVDQLQLEGLPINHLCSFSQAAVMPAGNNYDEICTIFNLMWKHVIAKQPHYSEIGNSFLKVLLIIYRRVWDDNKEVLLTTNEAIGQKIKGFIDNNYKDEIIFNTLTTELNMNRFYLAHLFKAYSGYSPKHYQTRRRIGEAQSLLLSTDLGVTEVANAVGYDNVNNFHRIFHNLVGIPPAKYKKFWLTGQVKAG